MSPPQKIRFKIKTKNTQSFNFAVWLIYACINCLNFNNLLFHAPYFRPVKSNCIFTQCMSKIHNDVLCMQKESFCMSWRTKDIIRVDKCLTKKIDSFSWNKELWCNFRVGNFLRDGNVLLRFNSLPSTSTRFQLYSAELVPIFRCVSHAPSTITYKFEIYSTPM